MDDDETVTITIADLRNYITHIADAGQYLTSPEILRHLPPRARNLMLALGHALIADSGRLVLLHMDNC